MARVFFAGAFAAGLGDDFADDFAAGRAADLAVERLVVRDVVRALALVVDIQVTPSFGAQVIHTLSCARAIYRSGR